MKCEIADFQRAGSLVEIFENQKLFINPHFGPADMESVLGVNVKHLSWSVKNILGVPLEELIDLYRVQLAAELLRKGVPFKDLYKYSGFGSFSRFERVIDYIVY